MKPSPVDRTFDPLSNGMHNSFLTKMSLRTLALKRRSVDELSHDLSTSRLIKCVNDLFCRRVVSIPKVCDPRKLVTGGKKRRTTIT